MRVSTVSMVRSHTQTIAAIIVTTAAFHGEGRAQEVGVAPDVGAAVNTTVGATPDDFLVDVKRRFKAQLEKQGKTAGEIENTIGKMTLSASVQKVHADMKIIFADKLRALRANPQVGANANAQDTLSELRRRAFQEALEKTVAGTIVPKGFRDPKNLPLASTLAPDIAPAVGAGVKPQVGNAAGNPDPNAKRFTWLPAIVPSSVRHQDVCNSCWAFAAVGVAESSLMFQSAAGTFTNGNPDFSEQYLVNVMKNGLCEAKGFYVTAWQEVMSATGVPDENVVPYRSNTLKPLGPHLHKVSLFDYVDRNRDIPTDKTLKEALCKHGPLAVCVYVDDFLATWGPGLGVFPGSFDSQEDGAVNHAVILVGWTEDGWIVRNSYGEDPPGDKGYFEIAYGKNNIGFAAAWATYALGSGPLVNPSVTPQQPQTILKEKDRTSLEIWKQLALLQAERGDKVVKFQDLRPSALKGAQRVKETEDQAVIAVLKDRDAIKKEWDDFLATLP
jgi:hypothetical protein